jgi:hypothetical protein
VVVGARVVVVTTTSRVIVTVQTTSWPSATETAAPLSDTGPLSSTQLTDVM